MPRRPTIHDSPLKPEKAFVCSWCNGNFRSKAGRTRHINAKHNGLQANSPQSAEGSSSSEVSSCPGSPSPLPSIVLNTPSRDTFNLDENDFNFSDAGDIPQTPPSESPSRDTPGPALESHPYLNGKMDNI